MKETPFCLMPRHSFRSNPQVDHSGGNLLLYVPQKKLKISYTREPPVKIKRGDLQNMLRSRWKNNVLKLTAINNSK